MVSWSDGEDGDGAERGPRGRVWDVRGRARGDITGTYGVARCRCLAINQRITVDDRSNHAEPRQWLEHVAQLPEYVGDHLDAAEAAGLRVQI